MIKVATLRELPVTERQCEEFRQSCIEAAGCYKSPERAEAELVALEEKLLSEAKPTITVSLRSPEPVTEGEPAIIDEPIWNRGPSSADHQSSVNIRRRLPKRRAGT